MPTKNHLFSGYELIRSHYMIYLLWHMTEMHNTHSHFMGETTSFFMGETTSFALVLLSAKTFIYPNLIQAD